MLSTNELWGKCIAGEPITCEDLGSHPNLKDCGIVIYCGDRTFYTDGINYYDSNGNLVSGKLIEKIRM